MRTGRRRRPPNHDPGGRAGLASGDDHQPMVAQRLGSLAVLDWRCPELPSLNRARYLYATLNYETPPHTWCEERGQESGTACIWPVESRGSGRWPQK